MIEQFQQYNESLRDKMKPKELEGHQKIVSDGYSDIINLGIKSTEIRQHKNFYYFRLQNNSDLLVTFPRPNDSNVWKLYIDKQSGRGDNLENCILESENWSDILVKIIKIYYPNGLDVVIDGANDVLVGYKQEVEEQIEFIDKLKTTKKYLKDNDN